MREEYGNIVCYKNEKIYTLYDFSVNPLQSWKLPATFPNFCEDEGTVNILSKETIRINGQNL